MANRLKDNNIEDSFVSELVGLPTRKKSAPKTRTNIDPMSFAGAEDVGFFSTPGETKVAGEGMKDPTSALSKEFFRLRPKPKKITGLSGTSSEEDSEASGTGIFKTTTGKILAKSFKKPTGSAISEQQRRSQGLGEFAGGGGGGAGSFGLPTDRLPTIDELGGALGGIARYVSQLSKRNRARGLVPGTAITKTTDKGQVGLTKATMASLTKRVEIAALSGDKEKQAQLEAQLEAIAQGRSAGAFAEEKEDLSTIAGL